MFIGKFELDNKVYNSLYYDYRTWYENTFSVNSSNFETLDFKISGYNYRERKENLEELAIEWSLHFSNLSWSYSELAEIEDWFYKNAKRYGLLKEFKENGIC